MVPRKRRKRPIGKRPRIDPDQSINLGLRIDRTVNIDGIDGGADVEAGFVCRRAIEDAECLGTKFHHTAAQFLGDLARERGDITLSGMTLTTGLHEG